MLEHLPTLEAAIAHGYATINGKPVYAPLYFSGVRILAQLLATGRRSEELRRLVASLAGLRTFTPKWPGNTHTIEHLSVSDRLCVLVLTFELLAQWPLTFVKAARSLGITASDVTGRITDVPYWIERVVDEALFAGTYTPSVPEIRNAISHLRNRSLPVTKTTVSRLLGAHDALRKRQLTFLLGDNESRADGDP